MTRTILAALALLLPLAAGGTVPHKGEAGPCSGVDSGVYYPAAMVVANVQSVTPQQATWTRIGGVVTVTGGAGFSAPATVDEPGAPESVTHAQFYLTLPIATTLQNSYRLSGITAMRAGAAGGIVGVPDTGAARFYFDAREAAGSIRYTYTYALQECLG